MAGVALPEIHPALYVFIFVQTFLFLPLVAVLAVARFATSRGAARVAGFCAALLALAGLVLQFAPALMGLYEGWFPVFAGRATRALDGMALPLAPALVLVVSGLLRGRRFVGIDALHGAALAGVLGLYVYTHMVQV